MIKSKKCSICGKIIEKLALREYCGKSYCFFCFLKNWDKIKLEEVKNGN